MAKLYKEGSYSIEINDECVPRVPAVRTVDDDTVSDAFYPFPSKEHGHHLQAAGPDVDMAVWSFNEQARQVQQEDRNHDDTIKAGKR